MELAKKLDGALISVASAYARGRALFAAGDGAAAAELLERAAGWDCCSRGSRLHRVFPACRFLRAAT